MGLSGVTGWCPVYHAAGVTSLHGPGDRPDEAIASAWLAPRGSRHAHVKSAAAAPSVAIDAARTRLQ